jgi:hypothetical protein
MSLTHLFQIKMEDFLQMIVKEMDFLSLIWLMVQKDFCQILNQQIIMMEQTV